MQVDTCQTCKFYEFGLCKRLNNGTRLKDFKEHEFKLVEEYWITSKGLTEYYVPIEDIEVCNLAGGGQTTGWW